MKILLKLALTSGLLWLAVRSVDFSAPMDHLLAASLETLFVVVLALFSQLLITSVRFAAVLSLFDVSFGFWESVRCNLIGSFFSQTFLSFLGGDVARVWLVTRLNAPLRVATGAVLLDRVWGLIVNVLLLLAGIIPLLQATGDQALRWGLMVLSAGGFTAVALFFLLGVLHEGIRNTAQFPHWPAARHLAELIVELATISRHSMASWRISAGIFATSMAIHLITVFIVQILLRALGVDIGLAECFIVVPTILLITMIPISIGGWGVRENAMIIGLGLFSVSSDKALAASILFGLLSLLFGVAGGVAWLVEVRAGKTRPLPPG